MKGEQDRYLRQSEQLVTGHNHHLSRPIWIHRPRGLREWVLHLTLGGRARFEHSGGTLDAGSGDIVLIAPGTPMAYGTDGNACQWEVVWAVFEPRASWEPWLRWPLVGEGHLHLHLNDPRMRRLVRSKLLEMNRLCLTVEMHARELALNALEAALLWCHSACAPNGRAPEDERITRARAYLAGRLAHQIRLAEVAEHAGLSTAQLARLFRAGVGCSVGQYLERQRLERAAQLLDHTAMSISAIAWEVGFEDPFYFAQRFRRRYSASPREYRRHHRAAGEGEGRFARG